MHAEARCADAEDDEADDEDGLAGIPNPYEDDADDDLHPRRLDESTIETSG